MTEVSSWSPTDASNSLTPPDGWPEGMQPSGVNDVGRMMMGAIRRWYNTVTAGIANSLPLSGGTLTGPLTAPQLTSTGNINATGDIAGRALYMTGVINTGSNITATGNINANGDLGGRALYMTSNINTDADVNADGDVYATAVHASGNINASGDIGGRALYMTSNINTTTDVYARTLTANLGANADSYQLAGATFATHGSDVAGPVISIFDPGGLPAIDLYGTNGSYYRCGNAHTFTNRNATVNIVRFQVTDGVCQNASGSWSVFSDASVKENLTSYTAGLAEVLQLNPQSFTYIPDKTRFAAEGRTFYGLVAQEVEPVLPEMVSADDETGVATLEPTHLVYVLINAVKELEARLAQVENRGG